MAQCNTIAIAITIVVLPPFPLTHYIFSMFICIFSRSALSRPALPCPHGLLQLLRSNESPDLQSQLNVVKICGDVLLIGGSNGFLSIGRLGVTSGLLDGSQRHAVFCSPICRSSIESVPCSATATATPHGSTPAAGSVARDPVDMHTISLDEPSHDSSLIMEAVSVGACGPSSGEGADARVSDGMQPNDRAGSGNTSSSSAKKKGGKDDKGEGRRSDSFYCADGPGFPHRRTSTLLALAVARQSQSFIAADDEGTLSFWRMPLHEDPLALASQISSLSSSALGSSSDSPSAATAAAAAAATVPSSRDSPRPPTPQGGGGGSSSAPRRPSRRQSLAQFSSSNRAPPELVSVFNLSSIDPSGHYRHERVHEMHFLHEGGDSHLIVSTNKRLLLLVLGATISISSVALSLSSPGAAIRTTVRGATGGIITGGPAGAASRSSGVIPGPDYPTTPITTPGSTPATTPGPASVVGGVKKTFLPRTGSHDTATTAGAGAGAGAGAADSASLAGASSASSEDGFNYGFNSDLHLSPVRNAATGAGSRPFAADLAQSTFSTPEALRSSSDGGTGTDGNIDISMLTTDSPEQQQHHKQHQEQQEQIVAEEEVQAPLPPGLGVKGWVEIDRAIPGKCGLFAMHAVVQYVPVAPGATTAELRRTFTQWRIVEDDATAGMESFMGVVRRGGGGGGGKNRRGSGAGGAGEGGGGGGGRCKCTVYRFEWTEEMFQAVLKKIKFF